MATLYQNINDGGPEANTLSDLSVLDLMHIKDGLVSLADKIETDIFMVKEQVRERKTYRDINSGVADHPKSDNLYKASEDLKILYERLAGIWALVDEISSHPDCNYPERV